MSKLIPYVQSIEDARLRPGVFPVSGPRPKPEYTPDRQNVRLYCVGCHHPGAFVTVDIPGVIFLCDQFTGCGCDCQHTKGELPLPRLAL